MDAARFDRLTRGEATPSSRRRALAGLATFGLGVGLVSHVVTAKKKRRKKVTRNQFGCVSVGKFCNSADQCCSGICEGKKGKKKCKPHDTGGCQAGKSGCVAPSLPCTTSSGNAGACFTTTGNAGYCRANNGGVCAECAKDADCQGFLGSSAACVVCTSCIDGTMCGSPSPIT